MEGRRQFKSKQLPKLMMNDKQIIIIIIRVTSLLFFLLLLIMIIEVLSLTTDPGPAPSASL